MSGLVATIARQGHRLIFLNVFLQQIGIPIPAEPTLVVAGGLAAHGRLSMARIASAALAATLIADFMWFALGRLFGARTLAFVFRLASQPAARRGQVERLFARWGPAAFVLAKFIPGLPMAGPVLAGGAGVTIGVFLVYDLLAMGLWAGTFVGIGMVFPEDVERVLRVLEGLGGWAMLLAGFGAVALATRGWLARRRREHSAVPPLGHAIDGAAPRTRPDDEEVVAPRAARGVRLGQMSASLPLVPPTLAAAPREIR